MNSNTGFDETLREFKCARCNECCKQEGYVYLLPGEADQIAEFLKIDPFDFANKYCELLDRTRLVLKKYPDETCIFLTDQGCSVYPARPKQCREFPIYWRTAKSFSYCEGLKKIIK